MDQDFQYDVFLSHSSKDKSAVRELAERLRADGLRVWFDEWVIQPGDSILLAIEKGLGSSRALVLCMSGHAFSADWVTLERHTALFRDPTNQQRRFIPVRLDDAVIPDTLRQFAYVDWRKRSDDHYQRLLAACHPARAEAKIGGISLDALQRTAVLRGHQRTVNAVATTPDGRRAVSGSDDNTVRAR